MKIRINKVFGKYDAEIDLSNKLNIFIGENGVGKSTIIRIIETLFKMDYIGLLNYYFYSIELEDDNQITCINYNDLMINTDSLLKDYTKYYRDGETTYKAYKTIEEKYEQYKKDNPHISQDEYDYIIEKEDSDFYEMLDGSFSELYDLKIMFDEIDNRLLYKILKCNDNLLRNEPIAKIFQTNGLFSYAISFIREEYQRIIQKTNYEGVYLYVGESIYDEYFQKCNIGQYHDKIEQFLKKNGFDIRLNYNYIYLIDMVSNFHIINDLNRVYVENKGENSKHYPIRELFLNDKDSFIRRMDKENYLSKTGDIYEYYFKFQKNIKELDFGYLLFRSVYNDNKTEEFQKDFYDFVEKYSNNTEKIKNDITDEIYNKIKLYLRPLLSDGNVISNMFDEIWILDSNTRYLYEDGLNLIWLFYQEYKDKYFDIKNKELNLLNGLFSKYFVNKKVIATPFGISISTNDYENDINFEELSAGEKKIIIMFMLITFSKDKIILLDEPEISLSVVWQKDLIKDIVTNFDFNKLIVATQSPYIVSCDEFIDNLICLPMENKNESE